MTNGISDVVRELRITRCLIDGVAAGTRRSLPHLLGSTRSVRHIASMEVKPAARRLSFSDVGTIIRAVLAPSPSAWLLRKRHIDMVLSIWAPHRFRRVEEENACLNQNIATS